MARISHNIEEGQVHCTKNCGNPFPIIWLVILAAVLVAHSQQGTLRVGQHSVKVHQEVAK